MEAQWPPGVTHSSSSSHLSCSAGPGSLSPPSSSPSSPPLPTPTFRSLVGAPEIEGNKNMFGIFFGEIPILWGIFWERIQLFHFLFLPHTASGILLSRKRHLIVGRISSHVPPLTSDNIGLPGVWRAGGPST